MILHAGGAGGRYRDRMQGTVKTFDPGTGTGAVLLDDGTELEVPASAFAGSGLRLLRLGQRLRLDLDPAGTVTAVSLITMP